MTLSWLMRCEKKYISGDGPRQAAQSTADGGREQIFNDSEGGEIRDIGKH